MKNRRYIAAAISALFMLIGITLTFYYGKKKDECLQRSTYRTTGRVEEIVHYKGKTVKIYFMVNGKRYLASGLAYDARNPVKVGDKFYIQYCEEDPSMNRVLFDKRVPH